MKTYVQRQQATPKTIQSKASNQASAEEVLQSYKKKIVQMKSMYEEEPLQGKFNDTAQREEPDEEELLQGKFDTVQREEIDEEEILQGKFETAQCEAKELPPSGGGGANNTGMPDNLKSGIENLSGYSMDDVRVHYNSPKPAQLQALAYAQGTDIHVAPGQEQYLPHEAWHVVQQKQGRVQPTTQLQGINVNDNEGLEKEADVMGEKANNNCIQGKFYVKCLDNYVLHEENPNLELYEKTEDIYENEIVYKYKTERKNIEFQEGEDIIYGLNKPREIVLDSLGRKDSDKRIFIQNDITNAVWNPQKPKKYSEDENIESQLNDGKRAIRFKSFLQGDSKFNVATQNLKNPVDGWKRTSKAGLKFQLTQEKKNVIFIVDKFELSSAMDKNSSNERYKDLAKQITSGEIRWLYRNKDNKDVNEHLKLYENGTLLDNKEFFNRPEWKIYNGYREYREREQKIVKAEEDIDPTIEESSKGCCYLTTACVTMMGLPDDCEELTVLRQFRDTYLISRPNGKDLVDIYYKQAPQILHNIHRRTSKEEEEKILLGIYKVISDCVYAIKRGDNDFAFQTYCNMVVSLDKEYN